jgi:hypothetical protein
LLGMGAAAHPQVDIRLRQFKVLEKKHPTCSNHNAARYVR